MLVVSGFSIHSLQLLVREKIRVQVPVSHNATRTAKLLVS